MFNFIKKRQEVKNLEALEKAKYQAVKNPSDIDAFRKAVEAYSACCDDVCDKLDQLTTIRF